MITREPYSTKTNEQPDDIHKVNDVLTDVLKALAPLTQDSKRRILDAARVFYRVSTELS